MLASTIAVISLLLKATRYLGNGPRHWYALATKSPALRILIGGDLPELLL
jgi:hypothetical protein